MPRSRDPSSVKLQNLRRTARSRLSQSSTPCLVVLHSRHLWTRFCLATTPLLIPGDAKACPSRARIARDSLRAIPLSVTLSPCPPSDQDSRPQETAPNFDTTNPSSNAESPTSHHLRSSTRGCGVLLQRLVSSSRRYTLVKGS